MTRSSRKRSRLFRYLDRMLLQRFIVPTPRLVALAGAGAVPAAAGVLLGEGLVMFWCYNALLLVFSFIDLGLLPRRQQLVAVREMPERAELNEPFTAKITVRNNGATDIRLQLAEDWPQTFGWERALEDGARRGTVLVPSAGGNGEVVFRAAGRERGKYVLQRIHVRYSGLIGLWQKQHVIEHPHTIHIYPDLSGVRGALSSLQESLVLDRRKLYKRQQTGTEFHSVREYTEGDDPRRINWRATARTGKPMTNLYRPERGKYVSLFIDCGRMMGTLLDGRLKLDRTLEAALCLAAVALKQGEQVSVTAFSGEIKAYVPPGKGLSHLQTIVEAVYDLRPDPSEPAYATALEHAMRRQHRRSLMVLFSDMESYGFEERLLPVLSRMRRTHLLLLLSLQDPVLQSWASVEVTGSRSAYIRSAALKFAADRSDYAHKLAALGAQVLDVPPDRLAHAAVNAYLELKSREAL